MDVPITSQLLQASEYNWKYRTIPMNTSCLSEKSLFYVPIHLIIFNNIYKIE